MHKVCCTGVGHGFGCLLYFAIHGPGALRVLYLGVSPPKRQAGPGFSLQVLAALFFIFGARLRVFHFNPSRGVIRFLTCSYIGILIIMKSFFRTFLLITVNVQCTFKRVCAAVLQKIKPGDLSTRSFIL
jgi:hypothetical protein